MPASPPRAWKTSTRPSAFRIQNVSVRWSGTTTISACLASACSIRTSHARPPASLSERLGHNRCQNPGNARPTIPRQCSSLQENLPRQDRTPPPKKTETVRQSQKNIVCGWPKVRAVCPVTPSNVTVKPLKNSCNLLHGLADTPPLPVQSRPIPPPLLACPKPSGCSHHWYPLSTRTCAGQTW